MHERKDLDVGLALHMRIANAVDDSVREVRHATLVHLPFQPGIGTRLALQAAKGVFHVVQQVLRQARPLALIKGSGRDRLRACCAVPAKIDQA